VSDDNVVSLARAPGSMQPKPPAPLIGSELGVTSPLPGGTYDAYLGSSTGEIVRHGLVSIENLVEMRRKDGQARALFRLLTLPIRAALQTAEWVEPEDGDAEEETKFANLMFKTPPQNGGMTTPLTKVLRNTLLALGDGYSVFEEVRHVPEYGPLKGKIVLRKLAYRDSRSIRFRIDDKGGFDGVRQITSLGGKAIDVKIPKDKVWYYAANEEENPYYGVSVFESAWQHYDIKRKLYYIAHLAAQFAAVPGRSGKVPKGFDRTELIQFKQALADFAFNTAMTYPDGYEVEFHNNNSGFKFLELIDHHNHMMSRSVLGGFLDSEDRPALVDIAKSDPQADMFVLSIEAIMHEIAESWTYHLMPKYIDWNFGSQKYPVFKFGKMADSAKTAIKDIFSVVVNSSILNCTPEFVREMEMKLAEELGLDIDYDEIAKKEEEAAQQAQEEAQAQAEQDAAMQAEALAGGGPPAPTGPGGIPKPPAGPPKLVAASRTDDIDDLVEMANALLLRHVDEDLADLAARNVEED
jgi:hypothetical protein